MSVEIKSLNAALSEQLHVCTSCFNDIASVEDLDVDIYAHCCKECGSTHIEPYTPSHAIIAMILLHREGIGTNKYNAKMQALQASVQTFLESME